MSGDESLKDRELERARECLAAAKMLHGHGFYADAISRAYYAVFHGASALLASVGRVAKTHDGLRRLISEHFVRTGLLDAEHGRTLSRTAGDRADADYNVSAVLREQDAAEDIDRATRFVEAVDTALAARSRP